MTPTKNKENTFSVKHSFNSGDLVVLMAGLRQLWKDTGKKVRIYQRLNFESFYFEGQINSTVNSAGASVTMNEQLFGMLKPLIEAQEYVESFEVWEGQVCEFDTDKTRDSRFVPLPNAPLSVWNETIFPQMATDLSIPWIRVETSSIAKERYKDKILINRTQRYTNPYISYYFLKEHQDRLLFSGTDAEHIAFCSQWNLELEKLTVDNFYQLAQVISSCKFGVYNQSLHFHLSDSRKSNRILELCAPFPNTFITGANGVQFYHQESLEYNFYKMLKQ